MRVYVTLAASAALLAGCIPAPDYGYGDPPPSAPPAYPRDGQSDATTGGWERQRIDDVPAPPSAPPAWEARKVVADAVTIPDGSYVVKPGDTLRGIAERTGAGSEAIARKNNIAPPYVVRAGQGLAIPGGRYHLVKPGETGIAIARAYGVKWSEIITANDLTEPFVLRSGRRILIPGAARPQTLAERAAAFRIDLGDIATGGGEPAIPENAAPARPTSGPRVLASNVPITEPKTLNGPFLWPVQGRLVKNFGPGASGERNDGIKIAVPVGTPIKATADGVVIYTTTTVAGLGGLVMVKHGGGWTSVYGHASRILVQRGQSVKRGQTIALSGDSGFADRPEVHFELRKGRTPVNPVGQLQDR